MLRGFCLAVEWNAYCTENHLARCGGDQGSTRAVKCGSEKAPYNSSGLLQADLGYTQSYKYRSCQTQKRTDGVLGVSLPLQDLPLLGGFISCQPYYRNNAVVCLLLLFT